MNRFKAIAYTARHRKALNNLAKKYGFYYPFHDLDKMFLYLIFGKKLTGKIHRLYSRHHEHIKNGTMVIKNKFEAAFDWESSRLTKPDKQETAYEYWLRACPTVDMYGVFALLGFLPKTKSSEQLLAEVVEAKSRHVA